MSKKCDAEAVPAPGSSAALHFPIVWLQTSPLSSKSLPPPQPPQTLPWGPAFLALSPDGTPMFLIAWNPVSCTAGLHRAVPAAHHYVIMYFPVPECALTGST